MGRFPLYETTMVLGAVRQDQYLLKQPRLLIQINHRQSLNFD